MPGWGVGGAAAFVGLLVGSFAVAFLDRRAAVPDEVEQVEMARADTMRKAEAHAEMKAAAGRPLVPPRPLTDAYKDDRETATGHYTGRPVRVPVRVETAGEGWLGTSANPGAGARDTVPNVIFRPAAGHAFGPVVPGQLVVIEGTCAGLSPGPMNGAVAGPTLRFTGCQVVEE